jgi:hypothetical protein
MINSSKDIKLKIINAGYKAVHELIKVAEEAIITTSKEDEGVTSEMPADRLKNAAASKKLAIFDAFEILSRIESEQENLDFMDKGISKTDSKQGFAERRSK